jgi:hypothetical protein
MGASLGEPNLPQMQPVSDVKESGLAIPARCDISRSNICLQFLQLDDMGEMLNPEELPAVLNTIGRANAQAGPSPDTAPIVIAFVHGWNHNADERDPKVRGFSEFLERVSAAYESRRKIVGIYIGWRGERVKKSLRISRKFSYFDREATAVRIPGVTLTTALSRITMRTHENSFSTAVFMGHSMGALLLERAMATTTANAIVEESSFATQQRRLTQEADELEAGGGATSLGAPGAPQLVSRVRSLRARADANQAAAEMATAPIANLVIYVNTAAASTESIQLLNFLSANGLRYRPSTPEERVVRVDEQIDSLRADAQDRPLFVSVTSTADKATKLGLPIGHAVQFYGMKAMGSFRDDYPLHCFDPSRNPVHSWTLSNEAEGARKQGAYYMFTAPHMTLLQSHRMLKSVASDEMKVASSGEIIKVSDPAAISMCKARLFDKDLRVVSTFKLPGMKTCFAIQERPNRCNGTPYWAMEVDSDVLFNHDDIFTDRFSTFLIQSFFQAPGDSPERRDPTILEAAQ